MPSVALLVRLAALLSPTPLAVTFWPVPLLAALQALSATTLTSWAVFRADRSGLGPPLKQGHWNSLSSGFLLRDLGIVAVDV